MKLVNNTIERFKNQKLIIEKGAAGLKRNGPKKTELLSATKNT